VALSEDVILNYETFGKSESHSLAPLLSLTPTFIKYSSSGSEKSHGEIRVCFVKTYSIINKITTTNKLF
jgi:hypothetical protein